MSTAKKTRKEIKRAHNEFLATKLRLIDSEMFDRIAGLSRFHSVDTTHLARAMDTTPAVLQSHGFLCAVRRLAGTTASGAQLDSSFEWDDVARQPPAHRGTFPMVKLPKIKARVATYVGQGPNKSFLSKQQAMKRYRK